MNGPRAALVLLSLGAVACGPPWRVVTQSGPPSALTGVRQIAVRFDSSLLYLGDEPEAAFVARRDPEAQAAYYEVKAEMESAFFHSLARLLPHVDVRPSRGGEPITLTVQWQYMVLGKWVFVWAEDSELEAGLVFQHPNGAVTDHIIVRTRVDATMTQAAIRRRMRIAADHLARLCTHFLQRSGV